MKLPYLQIFCLLIIFRISNAKRRKTKYVAAVLELKQHQDDTASGKEIIEKNLGKYEVAANLAEQNGVDLFILPEKGEYTFKPLNPDWFLAYAENVPHGRAKANPCNDKKFSNRPILRNFSCIAKTHKLYLVASLIDVKKCEYHKNCKTRRNRNSCVTDKSACPIKGFFYFNALLVFNRKGTLMVRYYKRHPFIPLDHGITTPKYPQPGYFKTEFGYFDTAVGFDIVYNDTLIDIKKRPKTTAIAYGNWWFDHTEPYYFGVTIQQAWCLTNNVTILSSNVHSPNSGSLGSGIYIKGIGVVVYSYNPDGKSKLLISDVPTSFSKAPLNKNSLKRKFIYINDDKTSKELIGEEPRDFKEECGENVLGMEPAYSTDYRCKQSSLDEYTFVKLNKTKDHINVCSNKFCCRLDYEAKSMNETFYFAVSGYRLKFYEIYWFGVQSCFLARCESVGGKPCRNFILKSNTMFSSLNITGSFETKSIYPHMLNSDLRLTDTDEWKFDGASRLSYTNLKGNYLLYADLYGRNYQKDGLTAVGNVTDNVVKII